MTVLEDEGILVRNKLSLSKPTKQLVQKKEPAKRKITDSATESTQPKIGKMLNGYRSNVADNFQECPVATLSNMGNTCFLNSVLYSLRFAPTVLHNLHHLMGDLAFIHSRLNQNKAKSSSLGRNVSSLSGPSSRSTSSKDLLTLGACDFIPKLRVQVVTEQLHELFITMRNFELKDSGNAYQPVALLQAIRDANYIFEGNHQQDAHELLVYLLDNIRETCEVLTQFVAHQPDIFNEPEGSSNNKMPWTNIRRSWKSNSKKNAEEANPDVEDSPTMERTKRRICYNFVREEFAGITLRRTKCLECESITERKEPFYDISVPIVLDQNYCEINPKEIFRWACVTTEKLCDSNKYLCDNCNRYNEASREVLFEKLPNIMVLQLKRFTTSSDGIQKLNTYLPTPLKLDCFCQSCCQSNSLHQYRLCCIIMHLGRTMASGHYIAYVKATEHFNDYSDCNRDLPHGTLSASSSEKSLNNLFKFFKQSRGISSKIENKNGLTSGNSVCRSVDCCGIKLNKNVVENVVNSYSKKDIPEDMWLECDDENVRAMSNKEFEELLSFKPNSTSTPYLLFYTKIPDTQTENELK